MEKDFFVYILKEIDGNRTYVGFTTHTTRRIKQHNGELAGGAKYTRGRKWEIIGYLTGFPDKIIALQCEWKLKNPYGRKKRGASGIKGRIEALKYIFTLDKLTSNSVITNDNLSLKLFIKPEYLPIDMPDNIEVIEINS